MSAWGVRCCSKVVSASSVLRLRFEVAAAFVEAVADFFAIATVAFDVLDLWVCLQIGRQRGVLPPLFWQGV